MNVGLTLGKYAPLHRGHQLLINKGSAETDLMIVMIYDHPEVTDIPLPVRAEWIRSSHPDVQVIECYDGPKESGYTPEIMKAHEDYVLKRLGGLKVTHFYSSEPYGEHMSKALGAIDCRVDPEKKTYPICGTKIRNDPSTFKAFLDRCVYRDLLLNVVLLGAPSTGKSTLSERLAEEFGTIFMPEYGREYWIKHQVNRRLNPIQLADLAQGHYAQENRLLFNEAKNILFTDTNAITTYVFGKYYHHSVAPELVKLAKKAETRYDITFLCDADFPFDDTWDRSGEGNRELLQKMTIAELRARRIPYTLLSGSIEERVKKVREVILNFNKWP